ncbi:hypothetical protein QJS04_geneDACA007147 [Acorus gramineus]|uniref:Prolactin receptor n=1 Tax=Acorus gramineus TaxID=55184 RepID=A0AAV9BQ32_ACOGR|nr:hypothetical protein QJS04_geneDACA007147 [Acorus gramineus]
MHGDSHSPSPHGLLCNAGAGAAAGEIAGDTSMLVGRDQDEAPGPWTAEAPKGKSESAKGRFSQHISWSFANCVGLSPKLSESKEEVKTGKSTCSLQNMSFEHGEMQIPALFIDP